jgi:hypothetical protein
MEHSPTQDQIPIRINDEDNLLNLKSISVEKLDGHDNILLDNLQQ